MPRYWKVKNPDKWPDLLSENGYSETSMGRKIGVSYQSMYGYKNYGVGMSPEKAKKVAILLGGEIRDFFYQ
ncbi:putative DNA-binding protein [Fructobacillus fructosus]|uniref:helix-turn-helix domain-containing protein n=1 Tax=Fructobacillus TaxID=559173 RepID=UPI000219605D|nr:helix-turn-helix transcriptional regulator [Fructobacillus fructosus]KRN52365.1 hypothetical protein IV71_GL001414 [Fructobacillus fructosus KCTC 3544]QHJ83549.1 MAG: Cro/C1-type helix-turn-helix domain protein [Caudoviricetes sp.]GAP01450.1 putative DNA-binding protein [Fructobacillus fructosus]CAK1227740.1 hypothetical protein R55227_BLOPHJLP_00270 [Fructobacillus tropaeoli]